MDDDASGDLNRAEFTKAMNDYKMGLNEDEIDAIFYECEPSAEALSAHSRSLFERLCCLVQV